jgi:hypothetical protein
MKASRQQTNKVVIWLDVVVVLSIVASRIETLVAYWRLGTSVGATSPVLSFIKQEWRSILFALLAIALFCTGAYLEAKRKRFAVMINTIPWIGCLLLLVKPALTFRRLDGESQGALIVMIALSAMSLAITVASYAWTRHSSQMH